MTWSQIIDDNFVRSNTSTDATPGSTDGVGNGWIDVKGGIWNISSDRLEGNNDSIDGNQWARDFLLRPTSESHRDQRIVTKVLGANASNSYTNLWSVLRYNAGSGTPTFYLVLMQYRGTASSVQIFACSGVTPTQIGSTASFSGLTSGHDVQFDIAATGASPTSIAITVTDLTANAEVYAGTFSDSTSALQVSGQIGVTASQNGTVTIYYSEATTYQWVMASLYVSPTNVTAGSTGNTITLSGIGTSWTTGTPGSPTFTASSGTITAQNVSSGTAGSITYSAPSSVGAVTITDPSTGQTATLTVDAAPASDFSLTPNTLNTTAGTATGNYTITPNAAPGSAVAIALTDGGASGTFTPSSLTFTTSTAQTFVYTPNVGASPESITLTATASGGFSATHVTNCIVESGPVTVAVSDPHWFWSPYNWRLSGSAYAITATPGAYFKLGFMGTSLSINFDVSDYESLFNSNFADYPWFRYSIDAGLFQSLQLNNAGAVSLATGLAAGAHTIIWEFVSVAPGGYDRWSVPANAIKIESIKLDAGASTIAPPLFVKRMIVDGDSITEGIISTGSGGASPTNDDATITWAAFLGQGMQAEYGQSGWSGQGWTLPGSGSSPPGPPPYFTPGNDASSAWSKYSSGESKLVSGLFSPAPDYIFVLLGRNDYSQGNLSVVAAVSGWFSAVRSAAPNAWLFVVVPFDGTMRSAITTGYTNYRQSTLDVKAVLLDVHTDIHFNASLESGSGTGSDWAPYDGTHPDYQAHGVLGAMVASAAQAAIGAATLAGYSRARVVNA